MHRNSSWSCIVPGAVDRFHAGKVSQINVSMEHKAGIQAHWQDQKSEGLELPLYVMQKELLFWLFRS